MKKAMANGVPWPPSAVVIKEALARHHSKDVFVDECKNGPTWVTSGLAQMDAWVLCRTWTPFITVGYEIKVTRDDFEHDQKWPQYLPLCHAFYFVCPSGLIKAVDLPPGIGLKWYSKSGTIHTKLRADRHEPDADKFTRLLSYVIMCRSRIVKEPNSEPPDHLATMRKIVESAEERKELASFVSSHIHKQFNEMRDEVRKATSMESQAKEFAHQLAELGIVWNPDVISWSYKVEVREQIRKMREGLPDDWQLRHMEDIGRHMVEFAGEIRKWRSENSGHDKG